MGDSKHYIEQECQQVQEYLLQLTADRALLQHEFEKLTHSSRHLLLQIQEDSSYASERKLHKYEEEKRILEEKLEVLERDLLEKDNQLADLDAKASDYLLQVVTTSNSLFDAEEAYNIQNTSGDDEHLCYESYSNGLIGKGDTDDELKIESCHSLNFENIHCCKTGNVETSEAHSDNSAASLDTNGLNIDKFKGYKSQNDSIIIDSIVSNLLETDIICMKNDANTSIEVCNELKSIKNEEITLKSENNGDFSVNIINRSSDVKKIETQENVMDLSKESLECSETSFSSNDVSCKNEENILPLLENKSADAIICEEVKIESNNIQIVNVSDVLSDCLDKRSEKDGNTASIEGKRSSITDSETGNIYYADSTFTQSPLLVHDQICSLSTLVAELRRVKEDMGKCMSVKETTFMDLEDQLSSTRAELVSVQESMLQMQEDLKNREECYQFLYHENICKKGDIEAKMMELQNVTTKASMLEEEKSDLLRKMEVLEIMMSEYRTEIEVLINEKAKVEEKTKTLLSTSAIAARAIAEISCTNTISISKDNELEILRENNLDYEKQLKDQSNKLKVTNKHMKLLAKEREHKQKECELLQRKVEKVELKMCELQGTFDMLVKAIMCERDELIKEVEEKTIEIDELHKTLTQLKESHEQELERVLTDKKSFEEELIRYKAGEINTALMVDKAEIDFVNEEKNKLNLLLQKKTEQVSELESKVKSVHDDMNDFVNYLKEEMTRLKEECEKTKYEKNNIEETFAALQADQIEVLSRNRVLKDKLGGVEASFKEKECTLEALKLQLVDLQQQLEDLNNKNFNLTSEMYTKEEELRDELNAREATIQELNITLTNNQKQSMENYHAVQEDMAIMESRLKSTIETCQARSKELEATVNMLKVERDREVEELKEKVHWLKEENISLQNTRDHNSILEESSYALKSEAEEVAKNVLLIESSQDILSLLPPDSQMAEVASVYMPEATNVYSETIEEKSKIIETLKLHVKSLQSNVERLCLELATKDNEMKSLIDPNKINMQTKIVHLTEEIDSMTQQEVSMLAERPVFQSQVEFEDIISLKEDKIKELERKVNSLENSLSNKAGYISELEGKLEKSTVDSSDKEVNTSVDYHLDQINKLNRDIYYLKEELQQTCEKCGILKVMVEKLESEKKNLEDEKIKLIEGYESKLHQDNGSSEEN